ncbi:hypothetical protein FRX31_014030, partial [Thalictrum thalictroides]
EPSDALDSSSDGDADASPRVPPIDSSPANPDVPSLVTPAPSALFDKAPAREKLG